ncbi:putative peptidoglycan lipid ii flippase murj [hydrocarbon metagenome]|uniref:Putative peptidoglycan lipid ii flippase murj n=1 Tax=hydrocarbon metagenome TaxID=938273 RepID=A0A0W8E945_9ZZZZ
MSRISNKTVARAAGVILAISIIGRLLGFVREQVIAARFGTSMLTDSYLMAFTLPNLIYVIIGGALATALIPVFTELAVKSGKQTASRMTSTIINISILGMVLLCGLGIWAAPTLVAGIAPGFSGETRLLTIELSRIMFPCILFMALSLLLGGILNSLKNFAVPAFTSVAFSALIIAAVYLLVPFWGIYGLAAGTLAGCLAQVLIQIPALKKLGVSYHLEIDLSHPGVRKVWELMAPAMVGISINQLYITIDRILASGLIEGSISALNFANRLMFLPYNLFVAAINTAVFPTLSEQAAEKDYASMGRTTVFGLNLIAFFTIPAAVGLFVLADPLVKLLFEHGAFDSRSTQMTVFALNFYVIGLYSQGAYSIMNRTFFSLQDTITPVKISLFTVFINLVLSLILIKPLAHGGLALATSIAATCNMIIVYYCLRRRINTLPEKQLFSTLGKIVLSSLLMGIVVHITNLYLGEILDSVFIQNQLLLVGICILVGIVTYCTAVLQMRIEEVDYLKNRIMQYKRSKVG